MIFLAPVSGSFVARLVSGVSRHCCSAGHVIAILSLLMLPVQMRAGTDFSHPHSIFQLLLDEEDGEIDHHSGGHVHADHDGHAALQTMSAPATADFPSVGPSDHAAEGFALLAASVVLLCFFWRPLPRLQFLARSWRDIVSAVEPPPPRLSV